LRNLPDLHRDPFDRIMIAQAQFEGHTFITRDTIIRQYSIHCIEG
jgi:PIN domain nuclease of toxin-antitoxin system